MFETYNGSDPTTLDLAVCCKDRFFSLYRPLAYFSEI
jgi:hypothetical protein